MHSNWRTTTLGETLPFSYGKNLPAKTRSHSGEFDVVTSAGVVDSHNEAYVHVPSIVIGRKGTIGSLTYCPNPVWPTDTTFFATETDACDLRFGYYLLHTLHLRELNNDSAVPGLNRSDAHALEIYLPPLSEQIGIAKVLGALDDKIVANRLVIEKIHALLHAKWHAITSTGASSTQPISSIADVNPRMPKPHRGECSFLEMKDLPEFGLIVDQWASRATKGGTKFKNGDVLLARITPCFENGKMAIVDFLENDEVGMGSTEYIVFRPKEGIPAAAIHAIIASPEFRGFGYKALTGTSGRQRIAAGDLKEIAVPWPAESSLAEYRLLAHALVEKATTLRNENQVLARTRDELLPLLMSGRITVGEAEEAADVAGTAASES